MVSNEKGPLSPMEERPFCILWGSLPGAIKACALYLSAERSKWENFMVKLPRPWVADRRAVE